MFAIIINTYFVLHASGFCIVSLSKAVWAQVVFPTVKCSHVLILLHTVGSAHCGGVFKTEAGTN